MISYLDTLGEHPWNANTVCKCLGKCPYNSFEALDLMTACVYEDNPDRTASLFPDLPTNMFDLEQLVHGSWGWGWGWGRCGSMFAFEPSVQDSCSHAWRCGEQVA